MSTVIPEYIYTTYIRTTPEKLWTALTQTEFTEKYWFGFRLESDWKVGSPLYFKAPEKLDLTIEEKNAACIKDKEVCKVLVYDPPRRLSYTFPRGMRSTAEIPAPSRVTFDLTPMGDMVKLRLVHENLIASDVSSDTTQWGGINNGWPGVLSSLKTLLETGNAIAFSGKAG
jgi:uncharacterized protein YndB with AHSA1/START domain